MGSVSSLVDASLVNPLDHEIWQAINGNRDQVAENLQWLRDKMHPYFFITMQNEAIAIAAAAVPTREGRTSDPSGSKQGKVA